MIETLALDLVDLHSLFPSRASMFEFLSFIVDYFAPLFDGFSLDIPLIMLVASILKVFYWFGAYYDTSLLIQACLMLVVQTILLKVALDNRPSSASRDGVAHRPFSSYSADSIVEDILAGKRPLNFWRWNTTKPYFQFLAYMSCTLLFIHVLLPFISRTPFYISLIGYTGLAIEAFLPVPQIFKNHNARSCKGFRLSVIVNWLAGDAMKMSYFFLSKEYVPWPFRLCGIFQACCDSYLGLQYYMYGDGSRYRSMEMNQMGKPPI
ncbi:hypothetical protein LTR64_004505 [Lithohypha guttulata]|uniref:uncharacterized protein n=1 Tax=Lithohypha guttulata TaxID=1690604 RepID=UPI00315D53EE